MVRPNPDDRTDHDRPPLSTYDHAPDGGDVDRCRECGRYAPHDFDHAPDCTLYAPIDDADTVTPSASNNPRMARPTTDGGTVFDKPELPPETLASRIAAADVGDDVTVWCGHGSDALTLYEGTVTSTTYRKHDAVRGGTHIVTIDVGVTRVVVHFDRVVDYAYQNNLSTPDPTLHDPDRDAQLAVTRFEGANV